MDINQVTLVGRLAEDITYTAGTDTRSSRAVARLIVNRPPSKDSNGEKRYDAIQIVGWGTHADNMATYTSKGKELAVTGQIRVNSVAPAVQGGEWKNYFEVQIGTLSFGRDSNQAKMVKAFQGGEEALVAAQAALAKNGASFTAAGLANNPEIAKILQAVAQQGMNAPVAAAPAATLVDPGSSEAVQDETETLDVENPFG